MKRSKDVIWGMRLWVLGALVWIGGPAPGAEAAEEVHRSGGGSMQRGGNLYAELHAPGGRFGLDGFGPTLALRLQEGVAQQFPPGQEAENVPPTPLLAGFLSMLLPGSGQLLQGDQRGWIYLGVEAASWFSYFGLHGAGSQAEEDYKQFADAGWDSTRYANTPVCFDGLGPNNFEDESAALWETRENSRDQYYQDLADQDVYACGWESPTQRSEYRSMISDADQLYSAAQWVVGALVLNHVVSAIDAAKSASGKRKARLQSFQVAPTPDGLRVLLARSF